MKSVLNYIKQIPQEDWDYYTEINPDNRLQNPFLENISHVSFIERYFRRGGKMEVLNSIDLHVNLDNLRSPDHINSVFFLGILLYRNTSLNQRYTLGVSEVGYQTFPFIWFLIALFHDHAYEIETNSNRYDTIRTIKDLYNEFSIVHALFDEEIESNCRSLCECREHYFNYRIEKFGVIDHGLLGGILLYDRLVKIRRSKASDVEGNLFWGPQLEKRYLLAAEAISIHNVWLPTIDKIPLYKKYSLDGLVDFTPIRFEEFPLFYILGVVDTIEPIKTYQGDGFTDREIVDSLCIDFSEKSMRITNKETSELDFSKLIKKTIYFHGWLDVEISFTHNQLELVFN